MEPAIAVAAAAVSTGFALNLIRDQIRRPRPHLAAYAGGIAMFAVATWALAISLAWQWTGLTYRAFFLFGAIINIPYLALGSMFLVVGRRSGHVMLWIVAAFTAISITLTATVPFARALPASGIPHDIFPPIGEGFGPRLLAAIGGGTGATLLVALGVVSVIRFWNKDRRVVWGNALIVAGTLAASSGGTGLAIGEGAAFAISLLVAVTLIWGGHQLASGRRLTRAPAPPPRPR
jgi:Na+/melibiose symporter-like transporter